jgi:hypothetical protein
MLNFSKVTFTKVTQEVEQRDAISTMSLTYSRQSLIGTKTVKHLSPNQKT